MSSQVPGIVHVSRYDPEYAIRAERILAEGGFTVRIAESFKDLGAQLLESDRIAVVILTGGLAEPATGDFLRALEDASAPVAVLALMEGFETNRIERLHRSGIDEVLRKPFDSDELMLIVRRLLLREELVGRTRIIGRSNAVKEVLERVAQYAPVHSTVLIEGESGTGKELVARAIHDLSPRKDRPFIPVNCAALVESLLESELFGHEKGAFTGASSLRKGRFELAHRGTLFLDEVGEMPAPTQIKLLRVLEEREFLRVGGSTPIQVDVRVIAATNKHLEAEVASGDFRRDLFYRLNVLHVRIPPLRERREDIPLLIHHFVQQFCRENDRRFVGITDEAMSLLQNYDWPGNVRELRNLVESMLVLTPGSRIRARDIPEEIYARANPDRLLPVALPESDLADGPGNQRIETLLGWFYRDLKRELDELRRDNADIRARVADAEREIDWLPAVEVEESSGIEEDSGASQGAPGEASDFRVGMTLAELERMAIIRTLDAIGGNRRKAASVLGIGERTLYRKLREYELS